MSTYLKLSEDEEQWVMNQVTDLMTKEVNMEWITPWHSQGIREGRKEGRLEEALTLLLRLFKRRFGLMRDEVETRVRTLPLLQIEDLTEAFLDFKEAADLTRWLAEHVENENNQPAAVVMELHDER